METYRVRVVLREDRYYSCFLQSAQDEEPDLSLFQEGRESCLDTY